MKINFIMPGLGDSGGMRIIQKYAELFSRQGHDVKIYCPIYAYNLFRYSSLIKNKIHQVYCTIKTLKTMKQKSKFYWVWKINSQNIRSADVVIATMWATAFDVANLPKRCGKKYYFIQGFEIWDNRKLGLESYRLPLNKIVISSWINKQLFKELQLGPYPVIYNGIDLKIFNTLGRKNSALSKKIHFLMMNHTLLKKGVNNGLKVFELVRNEYTNIELSMFGMCSGDSLPAYVTYVQNPTRQQLIELYLKADIFIFPSLEEGWGLTPIEAMACGCIVVGTNTGFACDIGKHEYNMMISEAGNIIAMKNNIIKLITNQQLVQEIKKGSAETVKNLDWDYSCKKFLHYLQLN